MAGREELITLAGFTSKESAARPVEPARKEEPKRQSFFESAAVTDVGKEREHNEDSILVNETDVVRSRGIDGVYILADGMGGHGAGEVASAIAANVVNQQVGKRGFPRGVKQFSQLTAEEQQEWLSSVVSQANHAIFERRKASTAVAEKDMGTTLVMAVRFGDQVMIANVGDSRAYMVSADGKILTQISRDHSLVANLVAAGMITTAEARTHSRKNEIYRVIGDKPRLEVDIFRAKIPAGGRLLLCSDGLWETVEDDQIRQIVVSAGSMQEATQRLIGAANAAGGEDNISAIVIKREIKEEVRERVEAGLAAAEKQKSWREVAGEMAEDAFAGIGFRNSGGNEIAAAAAFEFRKEIADGTMGKGMFTAMMKEINGIAKSYEAQLGKPTEQKQAWLQAVDEMSRNNIAETAFDTTKSRIVAAAAYRFRDGILRAEDQGASFKQMMRQVNGAVRKYRDRVGDKKT